LFSHLLEHSVVLKQLRIRIPGAAAVERVFVHVAGRDIAAIGRAVVGVTRPPPAPTTATLMVVQVLPRRNAGAVPSVATASVVYLIK
jgi:hypothetical protein